ncbi:MAG: hypothetical protein IJU91_00280 [Selenomonadaceae bacterium]|nr:hypothetical protein [Selenomonadaceae bacterium]
MTALRQVVVQMINDMPEHLLPAVIQILKDFKERQFDEKDIEKLNNGMLDPKKAAAFAAMEEWVYHNRDVLSKIDPEKERELAMEEKYGPFN